MVSATPGRFFRPQPSAAGVFATWLGVYLDGLGQDRVDWSEVAEIVELAYRHVAPRKLVEELDGGSAGEQTATR